MKTPVEQRHPVARLRAVIAGGGTGGHLFPGIAVAEAIVDQNPDSRVCFVGTGRPVEEAVLPAAGFEHHAITAAGIMGRGLTARFAALLKIPAGICQSLWILFRFRCNMVIGVGSYSAGPVALAARLLGIPVVLCEQNTLPGLTNRFLSRFCTRAFVAFDNTRLNCSPDRIRVTGNPVRRPLIEAAGLEKPAGDTLTVLVLGGSQGAHSINEAVCGMLAGMEKTDRYAFIHQTGTEDADRVRAAYARHGIAATVAPFFDDMATCYRRAHLAVCRAGATTIAELLVMGIPAIYIPYPHAAENHQELNASEMVAAGAAQMITETELTPDGLLDSIRHLAGAPDKLADMARGARARGNPQAAVEIALECTAIAAGGA